MESVIILNTTAEKKVSILHQFRCQERSWHLGRAYRLVMAVNDWFILQTPLQWQERRTRRRLRKMIRKAIKNYRVPSIGPNEGKRYNREPWLVTLLMDTGWRIRRAPRTKTYLIESN